MNHSVDTGHDLTGQMLIAMPGMADPRFDHSVVLLCAHSGEGAMGLIVNKRMPALSLDDLLEQLDIERGAGSRGIGVHFGGPVESGRGFVLHSTDYPGTPGTMTINTRFGMTATKDILEDIARGQGPATALAALGYAGWGPGQLESELRQNAWLIVDGDEAIVFAPDDGDKWSRAVRKLGIEPSMLAAGGGTA